jgi:SAM-dependent methyltransferase
MTRRQRRYSLRYRLPLRPWEVGPTPAELIALAVHEASQLPRGHARALDLGCGSGRRAVEVARYGWQVVGVDIVPGALEEARCRAAAAGVPARFVAGDVARLDLVSDQLGGLFDLVYDVGCFHDLPAARRRSYADGVCRLCRPGGFYALFALEPLPARRLLGIPAGVAAAEIEELFGDAFTLVSTHPAPRSLRTPAYYCLRRRAESA